MTASDMLCDYCGGLITSGTRKASVNASNNERVPGLQVAGAGEFSKANIKIYHSQLGSNGATSCWKLANNRDR